MQITPASIVAGPDEHIVLTGPITGNVTLKDGTVYDVSEPGVAVAADHVAEVAHLIGLRYAAEGHPDVDGEFNYAPPKKYAKYVPNADNNLTEK